MPRFAAALFLTARTCRNSDVLKQATGHHACNSSATNKTEVLKVMGEPQVGPAKCKKPAWKRQHTPYPSPSNPVEKAKPETVWSQAEWEEHNRCSQARTPCWVMP